MSNNRENDFRQQILIPAQQINTAFKYQATRRLTGRTLEELRAMFILDDRALFTDAAPRLNGFVYVLVAVQTVFGRGHATKNWFGQPWNGYRSVLEALLAKQSIEQFQKKVQLLEESLRVTATTKAETAMASRNYHRSLLRRFIDDITRGG
jgi:hypothetical protein